MSELLWRTKLNGREREKSLRRSTSTHEKGYIYIRHGTSKWKGAGRNEKQTKREISKEKELKNSNKKRKL